MKESKDVVIRKTGVKTRTCRKWVYSDIVGTTAVGSREHDTTYKTALTPSFIL